MVVEGRITFPSFSLVNRGVYGFAHPRLDEKGTWIAKFTQDSLSSLTLQNSSRSYTVSNSIGPPILAFRVQSELWMRETHEEPGAEIRDESSESRDERSESKLDSTFSPPLGYSVKGDGRGGSTFGPLSHWLVSGQPQKLWCKRHPRCSFAVALVTISPLSTNSPVRPP